jgi:hypothetical protein
MPAKDNGTGFKIWAVDNVVYGPVELPVLVAWVKEERVTADTWVYSEAHDTWTKAARLPELQLFFHKKPSRGDIATTPAPAADAAGALKPGSLRRIKILADLPDEQLETLARFMTVRHVRQWTEIVKQGDPGDAMFFVLEGEVRVRLMIGGKETTLVTMGAGEFFGEISLFDDGPRSADIVANEDSTLLRFGVDDFHTLIREHPALAAPLLLAIGRTLTARIRADNKRYRDSVSFARAGGSVAPPGAGTPDGETV